jgi:beta-lactamase superfamily II metal-dependent hydrolase
MRCIRLLAVVVLLGTLCAIGWAQNLNPPAGQYPPQGQRAHFTLWQLPPQTASQNEAYVLWTGHGKVIVVDGGMPGDAPYLREFLARLGNHVSAWFITHPHDDHVSALISILEDPQGVQIDEIYATLNTYAWEETYEPENAEPLLSFLTALQNADRSYTEVQLGEMLTIDGVRIEILGVKNPEIQVNAINNSSMVFRFTDAKKSVLFFGDLGVEGGEKLLAGPFRNRLHVDYVQMAHHGQAGVGEDVYEVVRPHYCLWPTPIWLWNDDSGTGTGSGPWLTLVVRGWMEELGVRWNYVAGYGLCRID